MRIALALIILSLPSVTSATDRFLMCAISTLRDIGQDPIEVRIPVFLTAEQRSQYIDRIDWSKFQGKKIRYIEEEGTIDLGGGVAARVEIPLNRPVDQMVLTEDMVDSRIATAARILRVRSMYGQDKKFREVGLFIAITDRGFYFSDYFTSNERHHISTEVTKEAMTRFLTDIEARNEKLLGLHYFHTHSNNIPIHASDKAAWADSNVPKQLREVFKTKPVFQAYVISTKHPFIFRTTVGSTDPLYQSP